VRVLVTSTPGRGHLGPLLPVAAVLREAGHDVRWATAAQSCATVAALGYAVEPAGLDVLRRRAAAADRLPQIMRLPPRERRGPLFTEFFVKAAAPVMAADVRPLVDSFGPDLVVHETAELGVVPLAVERGIPHVVVAFSGPLPVHAAPMVSAELAAWWETLGLALPAHAGLAGDLYLHPFPPAFRADPSWPFERLGPTPVEPDPPVEPPAWLEALGSSRPAVYVTFGTEPTAADAPWPALLDALGARDLDALITTGPHADASTFGRVPGNVRVEQYVPQHEVLGRVAAVLSHAGAGTTLGAASAGVPQITVPLFADQWDNADAMAASGAGVVCEVDQRSGASLGSLLDQVMAEDGWRAAAASVAEEMGRMPTAAAHLRALEGLART
jgi:UDP:flavonoid glycosyltransferase YjiC (YdhE family)